jgi:acetyl esterase/lipase
MIYKKINLEIPYEKAGLSAEGTNPILTTYVADISPEIGRHNRPAVLILPGGGYDYISDREGEPIAFALLRKGIQCFVLSYSVYHKPFPTNLLEAAAALAYIRKNAYEYDINPEDITCMGFSAGGHLAASLAVHWDKDFVKKPLGLNEEHRPNASVLCYPVISATDTHQGSIDNLLFNNTMENATELISLEKQVGPQVPRTFLWHCADDGCVPVSNSLRYAAALNENKIEYSLHIYENGGHGLALADRVTAQTLCQIQPQCQNWVDLVTDWIYAGNKMTDEEFISKVADI